MIDYRRREFLALEAWRICSIPKAGGASGADIVISVPKVSGAEAQAFQPFKEAEYAFLIAHSMLHLMGYDHMTGTEAADMERQQKEILEES